MGLLHINSENKDYLNTKQISNFRMEINNNRKPVVKINETKGWLLLMVWENTIKFFKTESG